MSVFRKARKERIQGDPARCAGLPKGAGRRKEEVLRRPPATPPHATEPPASGTERIQVAFGKAPLRAKKLITNDRKTLKTMCEVDRRHP